MDNKFLIKDGNNASWEMPEGIPYKYSSCFPPRRRDTCYGMSNLEINLI